MLDCDTDAEVAVTVFIWLVWITAALFLLWFYFAKKAFGVNIETFTLAIVLLVSLGSVVKYIALQKYSETIYQQCEIELSNSPLNRTLLPSRRLAAR
jgi:magnesium-transporting ATPase (P-type)